MEELAIASEDLDLEVLGRAAADVCILFTSTSSARGLAQQMHCFGGGRHLPFRMLDCTGPSLLLEEQLADALGPQGSGTVFLEDVDRLSPDLQNRLLDLLDTTDDGHLTRARVMASTSEPLFQRTLEGSFNERLFYRLNTIHVIVP
jgi:hypothetical protein